MLDTINVLVVGHDDIPQTITSFSDKEQAEELFRKLCGREFIEDYLDDGVGDMEDGSTVYLIWSSHPIINCKYCNGSCPQDENNCCDGYSGDIDDLYSA